MENSDYKQRIRPLIKWERSFQAKYGRKPKKADLQAADPKLYKIYKKYWIEKTRMLNEMVPLDELETEHISPLKKTHILTPTKVLSPMKNQNSPRSRNSTPSKSKMIENMDPDQSVVENVKDVWGSHLNRENTSAKVKTVPRRSSFKISISKLKGTSFLRRSSQKFVSKHLITPEKKETENVVTASERNETESEATASGKKETESLVTTLEKKQSEMENVISLKLGLDVSGMEIVKEEVQPQLMCGVKQLLQMPKPIKNIDLGWIERCSIVENYSLGNNTSAKKEVNSSRVSDDEDMIPNSDSEEENRKTRLREKKKSFSMVAKRPRMDDFSVSFSQSIPLTSFILSPNQNVATAKVDEKSLEKVDAKEETITSRTILKKSEADEKSFEEKSVAKKETRNMQLRSDIDVKKPSPKNQLETITRRKRKAEESDSENEVEQENIKVPIYGVEKTDVVPRLSLSSADTGDLISNFARAIEKSKTVVKSDSKNTTQLGKTVAVGQSNENYVRLNLKKKIFVRGARKFNYKKYKKSQWKKSKELASSEARLASLDYAEKHAGSGCFKCGEKGHFAMRCPNQKGDELLPEEDFDEESSSTLLTMEEAQKMAQISVQAKKSKAIPRNTVEVENSDEEWDDWELEGETGKAPVPTYAQVPKYLVSKLLPPEKTAVGPYYSLGPDNPLIETPKEVFDTLKKFGYDSFRPGQEKAIMRILSGMSTLVTLSTGSGKTLCYQIPAYLHARRSKCITLVVSPLVSLMDDQVTGIPKCLTAACLHTNQTEKARQKVMDSIRSGKLDILLVSPEAIVAGEKSTGFGSLVRELPPIAFACIDEAHCISHWSHNFRPSYLMLCRVLKEKFKVNTILGLTATATIPTAANIIELLEVPDKEQGIIKDTPLPDNLFLTVSRDVNRLQALVALLKSERFESCDSIIVYCTQRVECDNIAAHLRTVLKETERFKGRAQIAASYHAGLAAGTRKKIQKSFMNGSLCIVVATIAFGMGINKSDIRSVIHYNMPSSFERYVQEIGRAGRDLKPAHCHLFLDPVEEKDKFELRRHIFANTVEHHPIRKLLEKIFVPCSCLSKARKENGERCPGHEVALPIEETTSMLDIFEETISTLLCYLELHPKRYINVLSSAYTRARVSSNNGSVGLKLAAQKSPPLAMAIAQEMKNGKFRDTTSSIEFPVIEIASSIGWDSGIVKSHLKELEWNSTDKGRKRSSINVKFDLLGLRVRAPGDLTPEEFDEAVKTLKDMTDGQTKMSLAQLESISKALRDSSVPQISECLDLEDQSINERCVELRNKIREYFKQEHVIIEDALLTNAQLKDEAKVLSDIRNLINSHSSKLTGRAIARIFHGIQSPNYPATFWSLSRYWRSHLGEEFNAIAKLATQELTLFS